MRGPFARTCDQLLKCSIHASRSITRRAYSGAASLPFQVFNDASKHIQRERAAADVESSRRVDYLRDEIAARLCERLLDIKRHFPRVLDLGANACNIAKALTQRSKSTDEPIKDRISSLVSADSALTLLNRDVDLPFNQDVPSHSRLHLPSPTSSSSSSAAGPQLPLESQSFDAVLTSLSMHWVNDLPGYLGQINRVLKPDSPFLATMLGGDSLYELRTSLQLADLERRGGVSTHVSPLADIRDVGGLLTRAGFKMLTVDVDDLIVEYPDTFALMTDLQAMGESNVALTRELFGLRRQVLLANEAIYRELHAEGKNEIPATFRIIYMIGWTAGEGQPEPERRGSGQVNLADALGGRGGGFAPESTTRP